MRTPSVRPFAFAVTVLVALGVTGAPARAKGTPRPRKSPAPAPVGWLVDQARFEPLADDQPVGVQGLGNYRGVLTVLPGRPGGVAVVNRVPLDAYLAGVSEVPTTWPAEAQRAQVIAARTYLLYQLRHSASPDLAAVHADICATESCQVYAGLSKERQLGASAWIEAVADTQGLVELYRGAPIDAMYSSSNGGRSVDGGMPYLRAVDDPDDVWSPLHHWRVGVSLADVGAAVSFPGPVASVSRTGDTVVVTGPAAPPAPAGSGASDPASGAPSPPTTAASPSRPVQGRNGESTPPPTAAVDVLNLSSDAFTNALNRWLRSPPDRNVLVPSSRFAVAMGPDGGSVVLDGLGFGHGIGMSQYGALGKAQRGLKAADILANYYGGLRPTLVAPNRLPTAVNVALEESAGAATITGRFRIVDGSGKVIVTVGNGPWTVVPGPTGDVKVLPPPGYDQPFAVATARLDAAAVLPGASVAVRYHLPVPALVQVMVAGADGSTLLLPPEPVDAGDDDTGFAAPPAPGVYRVLVRADSGGGRSGSVPLTLTVTAAPRAVPSLAAFEPAGPLPDPGPDGWVMTAAVVVALSLLVSVGWGLLGLAGAGDGFAGWWGGRLHSRQSPARGRG